VAAQISHHQEENGIATASTCALPAVSLHGTHGYNPLAFENPVGTAIQSYNGVGIPTASSSGSLGNAMYQGYNTQSMSAIDVSQAPAYNPLAASNSVVLPPCEGSLKYPVAASGNLPPSVTYPLPGHLPQTFSQGSNVGGQQLPLIAAGSYSCAFNGGAGVMSPQHGTVEFAPSSAASMSSSGLDVAPRPTFVIGATAIQTQAQYPLQQNDVQRPVFYQQNSAQHNGNPSSLAVAPYPSDSYVSNALVPVINHVSIAPPAHVYSTKAVATGPVPDHIKAKRSNQLNKLTSGSTGRPTLEEILSPNNFPFQESAVQSAPAAHGVVKLKNVSIFSFPIATSQICCRAPTLRLTRHLHSDPVHYKAHRDCGLFRA
jgi:hypothetical protein